MEQNAMDSKPTTTNNSEYRDGYPDHKGWYDCIIDGEAIRLYCFICEMDRRKRYWVTEHQEKIIDEQVRWKEQK